MDAKEFMTQFNWDNWGLKEWAVGFAVIMILVAMYVAGSFLMM